jgi:hypothetical protein
VARQVSETNHFRLPQSVTKRVDEVYDDPQIAVQSPPTSVSDQRHLT